jgi:hypothetical protein
MTSVTFYTADGQLAGRQTYATRREALVAARRFVSRDTLNRYRTHQQEGGTLRYYHSYGEREALVREEEST